VTEDLDRARDTLLALVSVDPDIISNPTPRVAVIALNDYNVALQLQVWIEDEKQHISKTFKLRESIFKAFNEAGIQMPFETLQLAPIDVRTIAQATRGTGQ
jgi:small conductance mechanosensitive channel